MSLELMQAVWKLERRVAALEARSGVAAEPATSLPAAPENPTPSPTFTQVLVWLRSRSSILKRRADVASSYIDERGWIAQSKALEEAARDLEEWKNP